MHDAFIFINIYMCIEKPTRSFNRDPSWVAGIGNDSEMEPFFFSKFSIIHLN